MDESGYYDVYALAGKRADAVVRSFHDRWVAGRVADAREDYEFPMFAESPSAIYGSAWELIDRLLLEPDTEYAIYWSRTPTAEDALLSAHLFFTSDGGLIAGVTVDAESFADAAATLHELAVSVDARYGYVTGEEPPASDTTSEFKAVARRAKINLLPD